MDRTAILIDAGYLVVAGGKLVANREVSRGEVVIDVPQAVTFCRGLAKEITGLELLRVYWYDGVPGGRLTAEQAELANSADVKLRMGIVQWGRQKGVDSLIVSDLINLSRNKAVATVLVMSGDEDIRVGVQQAQDHGIRVVVVGIKPIKDNLSRLLMQEADDVLELDADRIRDFIRVRSLGVVAADGIPPPWTDGRQEALSDEQTGTRREVIESVVREVAVGVPDSVAVEILRDAAKPEFGAGIPRSIDARLLKRVAERIQDELGEEDKYVLRDIFLRALEERYGLSPQPELPVGDPHEPIGTAADDGVETQPNTREILAKVARRAVSNLPRTKVEEILSQAGQPRFGLGVPKDVDRWLLMSGSKMLRRYLTDKEKDIVRRAFLKACEESR